MKKITHRFEVAEEEARFVRNDVHNEALNDFKKMHSQRYGGIMSHEPRNDIIRLIPGFMMQGRTIQRAGGLGNSLCYSRERIGGGV